MLEHRFFNKLRGFTRTIFPVSLHPLRHRGSFIELGLDAPHDSNSRWASCESVPGVGFSPAIGWSLLARYRGFYVCTCFAWVLRQIEAQSSGCLRSTGPARCGLKDGERGALGITY